MLWTSLAIHELATNAIKFGALSTPARKLAINWHYEVAAAACFWWIAFAL